MKLRAAKILLLALVLGGAGYWLWPESAVVQQSGVRIQAEPDQRQITPVKIGTRDGFEIAGICTYQIRGRVLGRKRYWSGKQSSLVPYDVALGWGPMSDQAVIDRLSFSQSGRWYFYEWSDEPPIPQGEIVSHSANMHLIAADEAVARVIASLRRGQTVSMGGYLVNVTGENQFTWRSSTSRTDSGEGSCEVMYVTAIRSE